MRPDVFEANENCKMDGTAAMKRTTEADVMIPTECKESKQCAPAKHHYDECVERVTSQEADGGAKEDCVEECKSQFVEIRHGLGRERSGLDAPHHHAAIAHADSTQRPVFHLAHCATACAAPKVWSKLR